jgi:hypothetical protein
MKLIKTLALFAVAFPLATLSVRAADTNTVPATDASVTAPAAATATATADTLNAAPNDDPWQFNATPFLWAVQINGKVKTQKRDLDVGVDFDQIFNHLKGPPVMLNLEVRKKNFGFYTSPLYVKLEADVNNAGPVTIIGGNDTLTFYVVESGGFYQIAQWGEDRPWTLDALAGVRYWNMNNEITLNIPGSQFSYSKDGNLWDPFVGLRLKKYLTEKLSLNLLGEVGGFAISESTPNDSWQAMGTLGYDFTKRFSLLAGYRALGLNTYNKTGQGDIRANLTFQGAIVGLQFRF